MSLFCKRKNIFGYIFFQNCSFTFFSFFCFLQSLLATKTLVLVGQNEHIYFCIFAEREIAAGNVAKRTAKNTKMFHFAKRYLPRKFWQSFFFLCHFCASRRLKAIFFSTLVV
jgi:hypothetical protein